MCSSTVSRMPASSWREAVGIAIIASSALSRLWTFTKSDILPKTGTPEISPPCFDSSSSRKHAAFRIAKGDKDIFPANNFPASPAPRMITDFTRRPSRNNDTRRKYLAVRVRGTNNETAENTPTTERPNLAV